MKYSVNIAVSGEIESQEDFERKLLEITQQIGTGHQFTAEVIEPITVHVSESEQQEKNFEYIKTRGLE